MLKTILTRLFIAIVLQFAVAGGVYAFVGDARDNSPYSATSEVSDVQLGAYQLRAYQLSQSGRANLRSRSDVIQEVKRKYSAEVLKISLDKGKQVYRVRVLMKNGKVRNLQISALR